MKEMCCRVTYGCVVAWTPRQVTYILYLRSNGLRMRVVDSKSWVLRGYMSFSVHVTTSDHILVPFLSPRTGTQWLSVYWTPVSVTVRLHAKRVTCAPYCLIQPKSGSCRVSIDNRVRSICQQDSANQSQTRICGEGGASAGFTVFRAGTQKFPVAPHSAFTDYAAQTEA